MNEPAEKRLCEIVSRIAALQRDLTPGRSTSHELRVLCDELCEEIKDSYSSIAEHYASVRGECPEGIDAEMLSELLRMARYLRQRRGLGGPAKRLRVLDVGTGSGRDLRFLTTLDDLWVVGIDVARGFLNGLSTLQHRGELPSGTAVGMDMRYLGFANETFDIVRHNATLLHLPLLGPECGVDEALAESHRVLTVNGLLFALVKEGCGMSVVDTGEGLGGRFFQFFAQGELEGAIIRNGFSILRVERREAHRGGNSIKWSVVFAQRT